jgi:hypothetical protein
MRLKQWKPMDDFAIVLDDQTADPRTPEQLEAMVAEIKAIANKYDFDISYYGGTQNTTGLC